MSHPDLRPPSDDPLGDDPVADDALRCPLCGYDLRGLPDDHCPECGHAFDRATLRQIADERQQWFFEHARHHRLTAYAQTAWASLFPRRFWSRVRAGHVIVAGRLWIWATVAAVLTTLTFGAAIAGRVMFQPAGDRLPVAWPFDRAGVRPAHLWRVALYAWPTALLPIVAVVIAGIRFGTIERLLDAPTPAPFVVIGLPPSWVAVLALALVGTTRHLVVANARYLRVRHAIAQGVLVQAVVCLALAAALIVPRSIF